MTVQEFVRSTLLRFGQAPDNARFMDDLYGALNDSQADIANRRRWGFLRTATTLTTAADTRAVSLPSDFGKPYDIRGALRITSPSANSGTDVELMPMDQWMGQHYEDGSTTGTPEYAYVLGSSLYLSPVPDAAYTLALLYYKTPASVADSSSTITVPAVYHELLKKMAWRRLQDNGYSSVQELGISDNDIERLINTAARDDISKYGGLTFNLDPSDYKRSTI